MGNSTTKSAEQFAERITEEKYGGHEPTFQPLFDLGHGTLHAFNTKSEPKHRAAEPPRTLQPNGYFYQPTLSTIKTEATEENIQEHTGLLYARQPDGRDMKSKILFVAAKGVEFEQEPFQVFQRKRGSRAKSLDMPSDSEESDSESEEDYYMSSGDEDDVGGLDLEAMLFDETGRVTFQGQEWMDRILGLHKDVGVRDMAEEEQQDDDVDLGDEPIPDYYGDMIREESSALSASFPWRFVIILCSRSCGHGLIVWISFSPFPSSSLECRPEETRLSGS